MPEINMQQSNSKSLKVEFYESNLNSTPNNNDNNNKEKIKWRVKKTKTKKNLSDKVLIVAQTYRINFDRARSIRTLGCTTSSKLIWLCQHLFDLAETFVLREKGPWKQSFVTSLNTGSARLPIRVQKGYGPAKQICHVYSSVITTLLHVFSHSPDKKS